MLYKECYSQKDLKEFLQTFISVEEINQLINSCKIIGKGELLDELDNVVVGVYPMLPRKYSKFTVQVNKELL